MLRRFSVNYAVLSIVLDMVMTATALSIAVSLRSDLPQLPLLIPLPIVTFPVWIYILVPMLWALVFLIASVYDPIRTYRFVDELQTVTLAGFLAAMICAGLFYFIFRDFSRWLFVSFLLVNFILIVGWRLFARLIYRFVRIPAAERRVLIIGASRVGRQVSDMIRHYHWTGLTLVGFLDDQATGQINDIPIKGAVYQARQIIEQEKVNDVVIALPQPAYSRLNDLVLGLHDLPINVRVVPDYFSLAVYQARVEDFGGLPMINLRDPALNEVQRLAKRLFDLVIGLLITTLLLPILGTIALLTWADSPGPIIFRQKRVGENGRLFSMYKFRSMVVGAEKMQKQIQSVDSQGNLIFKHANDPRVTRFGRFLRRTSLDELPQLFNVLKGEMSLVGPRPELPMLVGQYEPWQHKRFAVPQGMTGWWQINGRADKPLHLHTEDDIYYIQNYSLWMDFYILVKTPWVVVRGKGAY